MSSSILRLQPLTHENDIQRAVALEAASYPADEAASDANIRYRQQHAGAFFSVAFVDQELVGFVNGTLTASQELEEESMSKHDPKGSTLCIHSVVIDAAHRRKGLASQMLTLYVRDIIEQQRQVTRIVLIAKAHLVEFYVKCGFAVTKLSPVALDKDPWFELAIDCVAARRLSIIQVDAFSSEIFDGNPAAVVMMPPTQFHKANASQWMQKVAMENNLSNTAFFTRHESVGAATAADVAEYDLRWFTPQVEVPLCGHATLSSAFVLYEDGHVPLISTIHFHTLRSGVLVCRFEKATSADGKEKKLVLMDFPTSAVQSVDESVTKELLASGLGISAATIQAVKRTAITDMLVHIDVEAFPSLEPDFQKLAEVVARGIIVTAEYPDKTTGLDFQSRFFAPRIGINEDPVTGSAHCALATYWSDLFGKKHLYAKQACPSRDGFLALELPEDRPDRVFIKGEAVLSLRGVLLTAP